MQRTIRKRNSLSSLLYTLSASPLRYLIILSLLLFILPPIIYYLNKDYRHYPFKWGFLQTWRPLINIPVDLKLINIYPPINVTHNCNSHVYDCPKIIQSCYVCIHDVFQDEFISANIKHDGIWQPVLTALLIKLLKQYENSIFLDIGANIGYFSAIAATLNHYTISIEPVPQNLELLYCTAFKNNVLNKITIISNAISDSHNAVTIRRGGSNQGDGRIEMGVKECMGACPPTTHTITLNDLTPVILQEKNTHLPVIVKIDAQGFESKIIQGGQEFFSQVNIAAIIIEWILMKQNDTAKDTVFQTMSFLHKHHFRPYALDASSVLSQPLHPVNWKSWPDDVAWYQQGAYGHIIDSS